MDGGVGCEKKEGEGLEPLDRWRSGLREREGDRARWMGELDERERKAVAEWMREWDEGETSWRGWIDAGVG